MSQMPPPPPQPAPMGGSPSAAGSNKKTYTMLAYVLGWIGDHPGYADLVPEGRRDEFGL